MKNLHVEKLILGMVMTNCYVAVNEITKECFFVDPADQPSVLEQEVKKRGWKPQGILLTHGHFDHIGAAEKLKEVFEIPIMAFGEEKEVLEDPALNLSQKSGGSFVVFADTLLKGGEYLSLAGFQIQVIHTPGHTKGGVCYYLPEEEVVFSGDTLFFESVGRTDLPTGSTAILAASVKKLVEELPEKTKVYPGHEMMTEIAHEKMYNPFLF